MKDNRETNQPQRKTREQNEQTHKKKAVLCRKLQI